MNVHEYQAKELLRRYNVPLLQGKVAFSIDEAVKNAKDLGGSVWVVKAQIHAGGRGKGGGVKVAKSLDEVKTYSSNILGMQLVTPQTGPEGKKVLKLFVEQGCDIKRELYCAVLVDRATSKVMIMASQAGGMDIEEVAHNTPEKIVRVQIDPATGYLPFHGRKLAFALDIPKDSLNKAVAFFGALYKAYVELDCSMAEINPLVLSGTGDLFALDAKLNFDDNALYRHKDVAEMRDPTEDQPRTVLRATPPACRATVRVPTPATAEATAGPITSTLSKQPGRQNEGSKTWVTPQHLARRTQIHHTRPRRTGRW